jgi:membrane fusion protein, heavy metal efflux system
MEIVMSKEFKKTTALPLTLLMAALLLSACGNAAPPKDDGHGHEEEQQSESSHGDDHDDDDDHGEEGHDEDGDAHDEPTGDSVSLSKQQSSEAGVVVALAQKTQAGQRLSLPAEIRFDADRIANVAPQVNGVISQLYGSEGDEVKKGEKLARLSSRELAGLKADYISAMGAEHLARAALAREEKLWAEKITSEADLLTARAALQAANAERESAENKLHAVGIGHGVIDGLKNARDGALSQFIVTAPIAGVIVRRPITLGETVVAGESGGTPMFTIVDDSVVWADIAVFKQDLSKVRKGASVTLKDDDGTILATGVISFISPIIDETSRTATARVVVENADGQLRPGQFVTAEIALGNGAAILRVPKQAVQLVEGKNVVFIPQGDGYVPLPVVTGEESNGYVAIRSGLSEGQPFVAEGAFTLKAQLEKAAFGDGHSH